MEDLFRSCMNQEMDMEMDMKMDAKQVPHMTRLIEELDDLRDMLYYTSQEMKCMLEDARDWELDTMDPEKYMEISKRYAKEIARIKEEIADVEWELSMYELA